MSDTVELVPIAEGNRITVTVNEKVIIGRGSSLGCNEKKISRTHAELFFKEDRTLWIKPTHANPVFYRVKNGKIIQLTKDVERQLKDGDQIGLLPSSYYFRVSFPNDFNNNAETDSDCDSVYGSKAKTVDRSPVRSKSPDDLSPLHSYRRTLSNQESSIFDFDDNDANLEPKKPTPKRTPIENQSSPSAQPVKTTPKKFENSIIEDENREKSETGTDSSPKVRKLPKWMVPAVSSPISKTPTSALSRNSSYSTTTPRKRQFSFEGDSNDASNSSDHRSMPTSNETKSPGRILNKISSTRSFDDNDDESRDAADIAVANQPTAQSKKIKSGGKHRPACQFGASCYRKNPAHRAEQSHPGDSDYEDTKTKFDVNIDEQSNDDKPECPFGKACYRQNPQHKRDFKH